MVAHPTTILSCDWGTSNLRLRAVEVESGEVLEELRSDEGIKPAYDAWRASGGDRFDYFFAALERVVQRSTVDDVAALVVSGMATSSIGMMELPYASVPFALDGSDVVHRTIQRDGFSYPVVLVSGVRTATDVMRGEETELIGLWPTIDAPGAGTVVLPGTHSKHVEISDGALVDFRTYMTGELFDVLRSGSVLGASTGDGAFDAVGFRDGVGAASEMSLQRALFSVRAGAVLGRRSSEANLWYLSGLLIGSELKELAAVEVIYLCAAPAHRELYAAALETLRLLSKTTILPPEIVHHSVARGHVVIHRRLASC